MYQILSKADGEMQSGSVSLTPVSTVRRSINRISRKLHTLKTLLLLDILYRVSPTTVKNMEITCRNPITPTSKASLSLCRFVRNCTPFRQLRVKCTCTVFYEKPKNVLVTDTRSRAGGRGLSIKQFLFCFCCCCKMLLTYFFLN
jgi:hypothetical protein